MVLTLDPPLLPSQFSQEYEISLENPKLVTKGKIWYDYINRCQRHDLKNSQANLICSAVNPGSKFPCSLLFAKGSLYVVYPEQQKCCKCCSESEYGCTIEPRNAYAGLSYVGEEDISGESFHKWGYSDKMYYYARKDEVLTPRRLDYPSHEPNHERFDYLMNTYEIGNIDQKAFEIPNYCELSYCPEMLICRRD